MPLFACRSFWASRFMPTAERAWLFEAWNTRLSRDWRLLYRRTGDRSVDRALKNRRTIWKLAQYVKDVLTLTFRKCSELLLSNFAPRNGFGDRSAETGTRKSCLNLSFKGGCRIFRTRLERVPARLSQITICTVSC